VIFARAMSAPDGPPSGISFPYFGAIGTSEQARSALAAERSGSSSAGDGFMLAWESNDLPAGTSTIKGQLMESFLGGPVTDLGGGCGTASTLTAHEVAIGNPAVSFELSGATGALALLGVSSTGTLLPIGGCFLLIDSALIGSDVVIGGAAEFEVAVPYNPALIGLTLYGQCAVVGSPASPVVGLPGISFSNLISFTLAE
jgi:hypothetical protein